MLFVEDLRLGHVQSIARLLWKWVSAPHLGVRLRKGSFISNAALIQRLHVPKDPHWVIKVTAPPLKRKKGPVARVAIAWLHAPLTSHTRISYTTAILPLGGWKPSTWSIAQILMSTHMTAWPSSLAKATTHSSWPQSLTSDSASPTLTSSRLTSTSVSDKKLTLGRGSHS